MNLLSGSGRLSVGPVAPGIFDNLSTGKVTSTEPGILVVYVDNQTMGKDVWFDNVQVLHYNTQVLEENHYYPFGLTISSTGAGVTEQPLKYQAKELERSFGLEMYDFHARQYDPQLGRFNSIDPLADKFAQISPYVGMGNNPVRKIDPDGKKFYNFDASGNYVGKTNDNWFHNMFFKQGRLLNTDGSVARQFRFADRKNDTKGIENKKLFIVTDAQMQTMVSRSGGFTHENKTANRSLEERFDYIKKEGAANGKMDFSYTQIPNVIPGAIPPSKPTETGNLFLPPEVKGQADYAHNHLNFGNYLFGASGQAQGFSLLELSYGAHWRALSQKGEDGYPSQFDSNDDQASIRMGYQYGQSQGYDEKEYGVFIGPTLPTTP